MNVRSWSARAALAAALALSSAGCPGPQTSIEQGQAPATGVAEYDAFFKEVVDLRAQAEGGKTQAGDAREPLAKALGVDKSDGMRTVEAAGERAKKLKDGGVQLHLQLTPEPKLVRVVGKGGLDADSETWLKAVEDSAKASIEVSLKLGGLPDKLTQLEKKRADLRAQTQKSFDKPETRRKVDREMDAAKDVIAGAAQSSARHAGDASRFVLELARAMETGGASAAADVAKAPPAPAAKAKPVFKWKGTPRPAGAAGAPATTPAVAPKPPPAGDDFDP